MDKFLEAYIVAALWSSTDESTPEGGDFLDENYGPDDLAPEALEKMKADCARFRADNAHDIEGRERQAGHDFWLTRNHHGCGYWGLARSGRPTHRSLQTLSRSDALRW